VILSVYLQFLQLVSFRHHTNFFQTVVHNRPEKDMSYTAAGKRYVLLIIRILRLFLVSVVRGVFYRSLCVRWLRIIFIDVVSIDLHF
jgi:hypothetical protein